jgi:hypothetical protein
MIAGKAPIEPKTALQLERALSIPARFWNNAERQYRAALVRQADRLRLKRQVKRLQSFPVKAMCALEWLPKRTDPVETLSELLRFFGVATFETLDQIARQTCAALRPPVVHHEDRTAVLAWLRKGEADGRNVICSPFDRKKFRSALLQIRNLTSRPIAETLPEAQRLCAAAGVALVLVPELPGMRVWGATRWLASDRALIQLTARRIRDDEFWFRFFHKAARVLLQAKKDIFLETSAPHTGDDDANQFAADFLMPASV